MSERTIVTDTGNVVVHPSARPVPVANPPVGYHEGNVEHLRAGGADTPRYVLERAVADEMDVVFLVGWDKNGDFYTGTSSHDGPTILWLLELARQKLIMRDFCPRQPLEPMK